MNFLCLIYIDRDPTDIQKGWGWLEIRFEDCKKHRIPLGFPDSYNKSRSLPLSDREKFHNRGNLPNRGRASTKKFILVLDDEHIKIRTQKSLSIAAICAWLKTWAKPNAKIISSCGRAYSIDGSQVSQATEFIYFVLNQDSNAIKIGRTKNVKKRLRTLQTASPAKLKLIKSIRVEGSAADAQKLEQSLHKQFNDFRLSGEWFEASDSLLDYISRLETSI